MRKFVVVLALAVMAGGVSAQDNSPGFFDKLKEAVKDSVSVNGKTLSGENVREQGTPQSVAFAGDVIQAGWWLNPTYTPEVLDGAAHIRTGSAGMDKFGNPVSGDATCDMLLVFSAKSGIQLNDETLDGCALDEYKLALHQGRVDKLDLSHQEGKARAIAMLRPKVDQRIEHYQRFDKFWFRPNNQMPYKHWSDEKGGLEIQMRFNRWGRDAEANGQGFSGPGWTLTPYDPVFRSRKKVQRQDMGLWEVVIGMDDEQGQFFKNSQAIGPDSRLYFKVNRAYVVPLGNGKRLDMMDIDIYRLHLDMKQGTIMAPSRILEFNSEDGPS